MLGQLKAYNGFVDGTNPVSEHASKTLLACTSPAENSVPHELTIPIPTAQKTGLAPAPLLGQTH